LAETVFLGGQPREAIGQLSGPAASVTQPDESSPAAVSEEDLLPVTVILTLASAFDKCRQARGDARDSGSTVQE